MLRYALLCIFVIGYDGAVIPRNRLLDPIPNPIDVIKNPDTADLTDPVAQLLGIPPPDPVSAVSDLASDLVHPLGELFLIPPAVKERLKIKCGNGKCKGQNAINLFRRGLFKDLRSKSLQRDRGRRRGKSKQDADTVVEDHFEKVFQAKKAYYNFLGVLDLIDPADDGVFAGDIFLNSVQLNQFVQTLSEIRSILDHVPIEKRLRRSSLYFENATYEVQLWTQMPIPYFIDTSSGITSSQQTMIRQALSEIMNSTKGRITFSQIATTIDAPFLEYSAMAGGGPCGISWIGQQLNDNTVHLNFLCKGIYGTIIHETIHALGGAHHHTRLDRSNYIIISWDNIDQSCYDSFALNDMNTFTTYGVPYSYGSIMHYAPNVCAIDSTQPTIIANKTIPNGVVMGQRTGLSQSDIDLLNRIYCCGGKTTPSKCSCRDINVYCGYDANVGYCTDNRYSTWMKLNCAKSCNLCSCVPK